PRLKLCSGAITTSGCGAMSRTLRGSTWLTFAAARPVTSASPQAGKVTAWRAFTSGTFRLSAFVNMALNTLADANVTNFGTCEVFAQGADSHSNAGQTPLA